jgi:hypothetical protein
VYQQGPEQIPRDLNGRSRKEFRAQGRPLSPGRCCEIVLLARHGVC